MTFSLGIAWLARHLKSGPRRPRFATATVALFITVVSFVLSAPPSASQAAQDVLSAHVDPAVSQRQDFFQYAGGEWLRRNPIPADQARWGIGNVASDEIYARLRTISEEAAAKAAPRGSAAQLIGDVWATGMDSAAINKQGLVPLEPELDRIAEIRSVRDLIDVVAMLHRRNMLTDNYFVRQRVLFDDGVAPDELDSNRRIYRLSQGGLTMGRLAYSATDPPRVKVQNAFREYLFRTFVRLHGDSGRARAGADAVYELEAALAAGFEQGNASQRMRPADLSQLAPTIDWNRYFQQIGATGINVVDVRQRDSFERWIRSCDRPASRPGRTICGSG